MQEKIRRVESVEIDIDVVEELLRHQKELNHYMNNSNYYCDLNPNPDLYPCCSCSRFKLCNEHEKERVHIKNNKESYDTECK